MSSLEETLSSWKPRRPSPAIERRLFARSPDELSLARLFSVLTPTAACLLLTVSVLKQPGADLLSNERGQTAVVAFGMSNQSFAAYLSSSFQPNANRVDTFGWTNGGCSQSSMDSRTSPKVMDLQ
jgi:hypothetical protein